jgi:hypothetical protein
MTEIKFDEIQANMDWQDYEYIYIIHGTIPELMPGVAYRRENRGELFKRKILKCPFCAARITDMDVGTKVELFGHPKQVERKCQFYMRCDCCHKEVGINVA